MPEVTVFKPAGEAAQNLEHETLTIEELEALRLKDLEGYEQQECADRMEVSRPTFQRVLSSAREKIARALVEGKAIRVEGGNYCLAGKRHRCRRCNSEFGESLEACPRCASSHQFDAQSEPDHGNGGGRRCKRGRCGGSEP